VLAEPVTEELVPEEPALEVPGSERPASAMAAISVSKSSSHDHDRPCGAPSPFISSVIGRTSSAGLVLLAVLDNSSDRY